MTAADRPVTRTMDLGFNYHSPDSAQGLRYDTTAADESTRIPGRVDLSKLHTVQFSVNNSRVSHYSSGEHGPVSVMKIGGEHWVEDGMHRMAAAKARGDKTIRANIALGRQSR